MQEPRNRALPGRLASRGRTRLTGHMELAAWFGLDRLLNHCPGSPASCPNLLMSPTNGDFHREADGRVNNEATLAPQTFRIHPRASAEPVGLMVTAPVFGLSSGL
jgi:hypothetical protein